ncbi:MAG: FtsX-like permease family protein, partial [Anaerolineales bacterium]|nr:FtsX-like permease family protein [Anaerolineales bacterium]
VGGLGTLLGVLLGPLAGQGVVALMRSLPNSVLNAFVPAQPTAASYGLAGLLGVGITLLASLLPARAATRLSPLVALKTPEQPGLERSPRRLGAAGLTLCLGLLAWLAVSPPALWLQPPWDLTATLGAAAAWITGLALLLPAMVTGVGVGLRPALTRLLGAAGRLMADNLQRGRSRVLLTVTTLALSLTMIGGLTGFIQFYLFEQFWPKLETLRQEGNWVISRMDITSGLAGYAATDSLRTPPEAQADLRAALGDRGDLMPFTFVIVPELSFMGDTYFSFVLDPDLLAKAGPLFMTFNEGGWDTALPRMRSGCGVLVTPGIAAKNQAGLGQTITVTSQYGPVTCTITGIGSTFVGASIISGAAAAQFDRGDPFTLFVQGRPGADQTHTEADLQAAADRHGLHVIRMGRFTDTMLSVFDNVPLLFNAFLLLAVLAAGLGVINTTLLSVTERRREFGQLRALGATRRQVRVIIIGEAALMGLLGGLIGLAASAGLTIIFATVYGSVSVGVENYQPWAAVGRTLPKVLNSGWVGLAAAPLICALAAYFPARAVVRGAALETLQPEPPLTARRVTGWLGRGSLPTRFVLSTAALLAAVLGVLVPVIVQHAGDYLRTQTRTMLSALVDWNAAALESAVPRGAQSLDLNALSGGLPGGGTFDAAGLLRFQSLLDSFGENGIEQYALTTLDNVVLLGLKPEQIGQTLPALDERELTHVLEAAAGDGTPLLTAVAPIRSPDGAVLGHVRLTLRFDALRQFLDSLQRLLWLGGGLIVLIGLGLGYAIITPLARTARALAAQTARISQGDYRPLEFRAGRVSLRTRLTVLMTLLVAGLVGGLGLIVIPIERQEVERTLKDSVLASTRWFADSFSEAAGAAVTRTLTAAPDLSALMGQLGGQPGAHQPAGPDFGRLQEILA